MKHARLGTLVRILAGSDDDDMVELVPLAGQRGIPVVVPGSIHVVVKDAPVDIGTGPLVVLGLVSGWAGAREDQIEVVAEAKAAQDGSKTDTTTPVDGGLQRHVQKLMNWKQRATFANGDEAHEFANILFALQGYARM